MKESNSKLRSPLWLRQILKDPFTKKYALSRIMAFGSFCTIIFSLLCNLFIKTFVSSIYLYILLAIILIAYGIIDKQNIVNVIKSIRGKQDAELQKENNDQNNVENESTENPN